MEDNIFNSIHNDIIFETPLAERMRPVTLDEYAGQRHLLAKGRPLRTLLDAGYVPSCILFGAPGTGKTTLVRLIAHITNRELLEINAVSSKVETLRELVERASNNKNLTGRTSIAFIDEIYHFNSKQQNVLLPAVEKGELILIGTTTENPWFEINKALLSRMIVYRLEPLKEEELFSLIRRALNDTEKGLGRLGLIADDKAIKKIASLSGGDARQSLMRLEAAATAAAIGGGTKLTEEIVETATGAATQRYDRNDNDHYHVISALIKSMRGSDPDAAVYWLARMLEAGEDLHFITRRLCIFASEDIGLADPFALVIAQNAAAAVDRVGMPESNIILSQAVIYLTSAPKSNSAYKAIQAAQNDIRNGKIMEVPMHLRNEEKGYIYPHDYPNHWVAQAYLPEVRRFYYPGKLGTEVKIEERLKRLWKRFSEDKK